MSLSFSVSFTLFSALVSVLCVFCLIDRPAGVEMFHPSLSSLSLHFSSHHSLRHLWRLRLKSKWERQRTEEEAGSAKDGKGKSLLLWQRTQLGCGQEKWAVEMGALRPSEMFCSVFLPPLTMWMALDTFSLFVAYSSISVSTSTALNKFLTVRLSLFSLKLLSYCCLRPKILLPWHTICTSHEINVCYSSKTIQWSKNILWSRYRYFLLFPTLFLCWYP